MGSNPWLADDRSVNLVVNNCLNCIITSKKGGWDHTFPAPFDLRAMQGIPLKDDDLVFCSPDGNPMLPSRLTYAWIRLVRKAGIKAIRLHDARHTHASLMLKQGAHPRVVRERLGNASIQITLDTYSHVAPGLQDAAAKRFDEAFKVKYNGHANELAEKHY